MLAVGLMASTRHMRHSINANTSDRRLVKTSAYRSLPGVHLIIPDQHLKVRLLPCGARVEDQVGQALWCPCFAAANSVVSCHHVIALNEFLASIPVLLHLPVDNVAESWLLPYTGPTVHGHTNISAVSMHQPGLPLASRNRPSRPLTDPHALIPVQHSTPQNQQVKAASVHHDSLSHNHHLSDMPRHNPDAPYSPSLCDAAAAPRLHGRASATTAIVPADQHHKLLQQQQPLHHHYHYQQHQQQVHTHQLQADIGTGCLAQLQASQPSHLHLQPPQQLSQEATDALHRLQQPQLQRQQQQQHELDHSLPLQQQQQQQQHTHRYMSQLQQQQQQQRVQQQQQQYQSSATCCKQQQRYAHAMLQHQQLQCPPTLHVSEYQSLALQQQQPQQTGAVPTPQQQSQPCAEDLPKHQLQSLQQQQQAHAPQGPQDLHQQGHPLHDATNHMHPWTGPRDKAQSNSQFLLDGVLAGQGPSLHTHTTAMQVPNAQHTAATTVGVSSRHAAATAALPSKVQEQRAEVHKAEEHKDRGFPSQAGHQKATKALPLQLMLYQWGLPQKVVQVNLHVHISSPDCSQCCYASSHATMSSLSRVVALFCICALSLG